MGRPRTPARERLKGGTQTIQILPHATYTTEESASLVRCSQAKLCDEGNAGRLRYMGHEKRRRYLGQWLLDWLDSQGRCH